VNFVAKPRVLRQGDTIGVVAPGSPVSAEPLQEGVARLERLGFRVRLGESTRAWMGHLAGADDLRARDFMAMWSDPLVDGIVSARGGWGSVRLLPLLDWEAIRATPKVLVGYSDVTILINAIQAEAGHVTFHGPMVASWATLPAAIAYNTNQFFAAVASPEPIGQVPRPQQVPPPVTVVPGTARGLTIGGNLSAMVSLVGTQWAPDFTGRIVFLEEGNEPLYKVDRMITHLLQATRLADAAGILFGWSPSISGPMPLIDLLRMRFEPLGKPCWYGFPSGHEEFKATLPLGVEAELNADEGLLTVLEAAVAPE
jgi:muramoyltetrapeptide carboxypeptidase